jgi:hypothetical protein
MSINPGAAEPERDRALVFVGDECPLHFKLDTGTFFGGFLLLEGIGSWRIRRYRPPRSAQTSATIPARKSAKKTAGLTGCAPLGVRRSSTLGIGRHGARCRPYQAAMGGTPSPDTRRPAKKPD